MAEKKKSQEHKKQPEEKKLVRFEDLSAEEKQRAKDAILQEMKDTSIIPSNPDSPHVKKIMESSGAAQPENEYIETYWWVKFHQRSNPNDKPRVELTVNGELLLIQRGVEVPLPNRYLECADHTTHEEYHQEPGQSRKIVTLVTTFPYDRIREATEEEFIRFRTEGTKATKAQMVKDGTMSEQEAGMR